MYTGQVIADRYTVSWASSLYFAIDSLKSEQKRDSYHPQGVAISTCFCTSRLSAAGLGVHPSPWPCCIPASKMCGTEMCRMAMQHLSTVDPLLIQIGIFCWRGDPYWHQPSHRKQTLMARTQSCLIQVAGQCRQRSAKHLQPSVEQPHIICQGTPSVYPPNSRSQSKRKNTGLPPTSAWSTCLAHTFAP